MISMEVLCVSFRLTMFFKCGTTYILYVTRASITSPICYRKIHHDIIHIHSFSVGFQQPEHVLAHRPRGYAYKPD